MFIQLNIRIQIDVLNSHRYTTSMELMRKCKQKDDFLEM